MPVIVEKVENKFYDLESAKKYIHVLSCYKKILKKPWKSPTPKIISDYKTSCQS